MNSRIRATLSSSTRYSTLSTSTLSASGSLSKRQANTAHHRNLNAVNAARRERSKKFTRCFLIVTPGLTIRDRLRVLQPNDPDSYYKSRELVPNDMLVNVERVKIVITNYHAFKLRERLELSKGGRSLLQGRGEALNTIETEGQMVQRVMPDLWRIKNIMVINDEAHHCYREKPNPDIEERLKGDERKESEEHNEAVHLRISGIETVADNTPGGEMPKSRNLWEHIPVKMPKNRAACALLEFQ